MLKQATNKQAPADIARWAINARTKGGEALYSQPNVIVSCDTSDLFMVVRNTQLHCVKDHTQARGALQSPYIVQLMTYHFESIEGAVIDAGPPVGALSLAVVAVSHA